MVDELKLKLLNKYDLTMLFNNEGIPENLEISYLVDRDINGEIHDVIKVHYNIEDNKYSWSQVRSNDWGDKNIMTKGTLEDLKENGPYLFGIIDSEKDISFNLQYGMKCSEMMEALGSGDLVQRLRNANLIVPSEEDIKTERKLYSNIRA